MEKQRKADNCLAAAAILFVLTVVQIGAIWHNRWWTIPCVATAILALKFWERFLNHESNLDS